MGKPNPLQQARSAKPPRKPVPAPPVPKFIAVKGPPPVKRPVPPQFVGKNFKKGMKNANPMPFVPRKFHEIAALARERSVDAIMELAYIMTNRAYKPRDRAYAASLILDRGLGKAPQLIKLAGDGDKGSGGGGSDPGAGPIPVVADAERVGEIIRILQAAGALETVTGLKSANAEPEDATCEEVT